MKYLFIAKKYQNTLRGGYTSNIRFYEKYSSFITLNQKDEYNHIVYRNYPNLCKFIEIYNNNDIVFISLPNKDWEYSNLKIVTDGWSRFKYSPNIKCCIPIITPFYVNQNQTSDIKIGIYSTHSTKSTQIPFIQDIANKYPTLLLGDPINKIPQTYDNIYFFQNITHYLHLPTEQFFETFPQTLLEAISCNKQIIIPNIKRTFKDGIDDIKECISYHININDKYICNKNTILNHIHWNNFYLKLFQNGFYYQQPKYNSFSQWCQKEL